MDLGKLTALQLAEKIKQHQISVLDGVKYVFDQIEAKEDKVHAYLDTYKKEAYAQLKDLKKQIRENPQVVLVLERSTERYVVKP